MLTFELWLIECGLSDNPKASNYFGRFYVIGELKRWFNTGVDPWEVQSAVNEFERLTAARGNYVINGNRRSGTVN